MIKSFRGHKSTKPTKSLGSSGETWIFAASTLIQQTYDWEKWDWFCPYRPSELFRQQGGRLEDSLLSWHRKSLDFGDFFQGRPDELSKEPLASISRSLPPL